MNDDGSFVGIAGFEVPINKKKTTIEWRPYRHDVQPSESTAAAMW
jgi:hypothetical protein